MYRLSFLIGMLVLVCVSISAVDREPVNVLLFTGGHDFNREEFFAGLDTMDHVLITELAQPDANKAFTDGRAMEADVILLYDMWQSISEEEKQGFLGFLKAGKGLVAVHHCIASYQAWPEFTEILGGKYMLEAGEVAGQSHGASTFKHDIPLLIRIEDREHPVMHGFDDFMIFDEGYGNLYLSPDAHVLMTTDHAEASTAMAWTNTYEQARVVYIQPGHGVEAFRHPMFQRLIENAVHWVHANE